MKITIIGGGTMGEALVKSILRKKLAGGHDITFCDIRPERLAELKKEYGATTTTDVLVAVKGADVVVFSIKPQDIEHVLDKLKGQLKTQLVISIVAGWALPDICDRLNYRHVVRAMPNTPAQVGKGMTVWTSTEQLTKADLELAASVLQSTGEEEYVEEEKYLDMATAVSGSGPAYVFLFVEAMIDAGVHIGLPRHIARKLVIETIAGSAEMIKKMSTHPAELKNMVTSPGGTTTEALLQFEKGGLRSVMIEAVIAAYIRAKDLGKK